MKVKSQSVSRPGVSDSSQPRGLCSPADSSVRGILQTRMLPFSSSGDLPNPGLEPGSPALQADSLLSEPPGKAQINL